MKKVIKNIFDWLISLLFLAGVIHNIIGLSNLIEPIFKWASGFISFLICFGVIFYFGYDLEKKIKED